MVNWYYWLAMRSGSVGGVGIAGNLKWKYNAGGNIESVIVVGSDGVIYFGNRTKVFAVNSDGTLKWDYSVGCATAKAGLALSNDGSVVYAIDAGCDVYAIYTATGNLKWRYGWLEGDGELPGYSGIVVDNNDDIYVGGSSVEGLFSLDYAGNFRWDLGADECHSGHAIGKSNTVIYYLDVSFGLREVRLSDGNINWGTQGLGWGDWGTGISIASDGTIYYGDTGYFYARNPDGSEKWHFSVSDHPGTNNAIGSNSNIWFVDRNPGTVIVVNSSGSEVWRYDLPSWVGSGFAATGLALDSNDIAYVGCADNKLYALNSDGTLRWSYTTGNNVESGIAFSPSEDTVYFGSDDGYLYAIE